MCAILIWQDVDGWALKLEVLRLLVALTINWRRLVQPHMPGLLQQCWAMFTGCIPLYAAAVVAADADLDDGEVLSTMPTFWVYFFPHVNVHRTSTVFLCFAQGVVNP